MNVYQNSRSIGLQHLRQAEVTVGVGEACSGVGKPQGSKFVKIVETLGSLKVLGKNYPAAGL